jgi:hypothetical protein
MNEGSRITWPIALMKSFVATSDRWESQNDKMAKP